MALKDERVRDFLATRRAKITPDLAGLPRGSGVRRVPGLRREEVAILSGVSVDYYTRIEKGDLSGVSDEILDAIARALQFDEDERAYLYDLARTARRPSRAPRQRRASAPVSQQVQLLIDSMAAMPVIAINRRLDLVAANALGRALFDVVRTSPTRRSAASPPNIAAFIFLDPGAEDFYADLDDAAATSVRILRTQAGATPHDAELTRLIGELSTRSPEFSARWAAHDVGIHRSGAKVLRHHGVGELTLGFEELALESAPGLRLSAYVAEPHSPTAERLQLLAAWAATEDTGVRDADGGRDADGVRDAARF
ncbi:transcriptional regulator [Leucobacter sp. OLJS4]|uniref:helix-turn-helix domain-containing protein n=1 Tax=unclassified Leucobacter TaxID=2621730 RepID=UPI000C1856D9|nr:MULTISPECIES: helix-turn-helix transcriptional regulator [unclassified Leucobacter]PIJ37369.1 transcriptional regulator [Leucobacter sp. OLES1]PII83000.1 transcriptional regulator [Leucobacter sp. OLCALW19]PII91664.1 transcriptional regulator [Leucobacter sp. OLTLW20]PII91750.1 transcriptional regulator [Leucobacter sp. OLAS13]PII97613.1 transcriptional regulator [Leucobacter sp. OLCS4]